MRVRARERDVEGPVNVDFDRAGDGYRTHVSVKSVPVILRATATSRVFGSRRLHASHAQ